MIDIFIPFKQFFKINSCVIDSLTFRLHYKLTLIFLVIAVVLLSSKQFLGNPINCIGGGEITDQDAVNSYCFVYGTYTVYNEKNTQITGVQAGVRSSLPGDQKIRHNYYQWVVFMMLFQAVLFYMPRLLWKICEEGRICSLSANLSGPIIPKEWAEYRRDQIISYFNYTSVFTHNVYCLKYIFCEVLNFVNVVGQIFMIDKFLGGTFRDYGYAVSTFTRIPSLPSLDAQVDPMDRYFPKLTKCTLQSYSIGGDIVESKKLCVLPLNIVNEKVYAIQWFWFITLAVLTGLSLIYRILAIYIPRVQAYILQSQLRIPYSRSTLTLLVQRYGFGGWFVLNLLGRNMNPQMFKDLVNELAKEVKMCDEEKKIGFEKI